MIFWMRPFSILPLALPRVSYCQLSFLRITLSFARRPVWTFVDIAYIRPVEGKIIRARLTSSMIPDSDRELLFTTKISDARDFVALLEFDKLKPIASNHWG